MKIAICGSMACSGQMLEAGAKLNQLGHETFLPHAVEDFAAGRKVSLGGSEGAKDKIANDLIRAHYNLIKESDAILVVNCNKGDAENYIGGNSFLEIGFAYILNKKIFLLNPIPEVKLIKQEIEAMQPVILHGDVSGMG